MTKIAPIAIITTILFFLTACGGSQEPLTPTEETTRKQETVTFAANSAYKKVDMQRKDISIKNDDGEILGILYFDLPQIQIKGNSKAIRKINEYLQNEYDLWKNGSDKFLNGHSDNRMEWIEDGVNRFRESYGDEVLIASPLRYSVDMGIAHMDQNIFSLRATVYLAGGGPISCNCFGYTFNLKTGESILFTDIVKVNVDELKRKLSELILGYNIFDLSIIPKKLDAMKKDSLVYLSYDVEFNLACEYYYNGKDICILLDRISDARTSYICKWNGETGTAFAASLWAVDENDEVITEYRVDGG